MQYIHSHIYSINIRPFQSNQGQQLYVYLYRDWVTRKNLRTSSRGKIEKNYEEQGQLERGEKRWINELKDGGRRERKKRWKNGRKIKGIMNRGVNRRKEERESGKEWVKK